MAKQASVQHRKSFWWLFVPPPVWGSSATHCLRTGTAVSAGGTAFYALILLLEEIRLGFLYLDQSPGETCFRGLEAGDTIGS